MAQVAEWYWRRAKTEGGPVTWDSLQLLASSGKLGPRDFVRRQSWANWKHACDVDEHDQAITPAPGASTAPPTLPSMESPSGSPPPSPDPADEPPALGLLSVIGVKPAEPGLLPEGPFPPPIPPAAPSVPASTPVRHSRREVPVKAVDRKEVAPPPPEPPVYRGAFPFRDADAAQWRRPATPLNGAAVAAVFASLAGLVVFALPLGAVAVGLGGWGMIVAEDNADSRSRRVALMGLFFGAADVVAWLVHAAVHVNAVAA